MSDTNWADKLKVVNKFLLLLSITGGFVIGFAFMLAFNFAVLDCILLGLVISALSGVIALFVVAISSVVIQELKNIQISINQLKKQTEIIEKIAAEISKQ